MLPGLNVQRLYILFFSFFHECKVAAWDRLEHYVYADSVSTGVGDCRYHVITGQRHLQIYLPLAIANIFEQTIGALPMTVGVTSTQVPLELKYSFGTGFPISEGPTGRPFFVIVNEMGIALPRLYVPPHLPDGSPPALTTTGVFAQAWLAGRGGIAGGVRGCNLEAIVSAFVEAGYYISCTRRAAQKRLRSSYKRSTSWPSPHRCPRTRSRKA